MNPRPLQQRHALVCGASRGIGRATAKLLAERGATVTCLARNQTALTALIEEIEAAGGTAHALAADLDQTEALASQVERLIEERGPVHIVIHNTGGPPSGALTKASSDELLTAYRRHVLSAQTIMQRTLPGMIASEYGRFIQVLSTSVREPIPNLGVSNLTQAAMASWAKTPREFPAGDHQQHPAGLHGHRPPDRAKTCGRGEARCHPVRRARRMAGQFRKADSLSLRKPRRPSPSWCRQKRHTFVACHWP